jgi:hypothetical protein
VTGSCGVGHVCLPGTQHPATKTRELDEGHSPQLTSRKLRTKPGKALGRESQSCPDLRDELPREKDRTVQRCQWK